MRSREGLVAVLYALLAVLVVPVFPHFVSPNELTRWALAASVVERGTLEISGVAALLGPSFEDVSEKDGRLYSNKAPGLALVALPGYLMARPFVGPPSPASIRPTVYAMRLVGATLPALLLFFSFRWAASKLGGEAARVAPASAMLFFGTPLFAYGLLLFSHALVAACLFGAWALLFVPGSARRDRAQACAAGALLGLATVSEYPAAIPAAILAVAAAAVRPRRLLAVALGALPFAAGLLAYDRVCFGGFLELSSGHERFGGFQALSSGGLFGIGVPSPGILLRLLADPGKGLFVFSPFLLLVWRALPLMARVLPRAATIAVVLVPASIVLTYAGYPNWHGGFTVGARYLVAALPFLVFPLVFRGGGRLEAGLAGASIAAVAITSLVFPFVPPGFALPWGSFAAPLLSRGLVAPNLLHIAGRPPALAVPAAVVAVAAVIAFGTKRLGPLALGGILWAGAGLALARLAPPGPAERLQRAYVEDVYFERRGALEKALEGLPAQPRLLARRERDLALPPASWPF